MDVKWARAWFAVTAACVAVGVIMQLVLAWQNHMPEIAETESCSRSSAVAR